MKIIKTSEYIEILNHNFNQAVIDRLIVNGFVKKEGRFISNNIIDFRKVLEILK